ncbi:MAG: hypothetical protein LBG99_03325 [Propionibacteriaceae bacterium]|nr:hypothetical protein [Propionibacteriaceae bacterium]
MKRIKIITLCAVVVCVFTGCTIGRDGGLTSRNEVPEINNHELFDYDGPFVSPSGQYEAVIENYDDDGVRSYKLFIVTVDGSEPPFEADLIFRARDKNYVYWADEEDIVWGYSGDVGAYFWVKEDGFWVEKSYADHQDAKVPQGLKDARPKYFE